MECYHISNKSCTNGKKKKKKTKGLRFRWPKLIWTLVPKGEKLGKKGANKITWVTHACLLISFVSDYGEIFYKFFSKKSLN
jgi:hypothetical protein